MASLVLFDLDLELDLKKVYQEAKDTVKYLNDLIASIETRVLGGEKIPGLVVVNGKKSRAITEPGLKYLSKVLGKNVVYETVEKPITLGKLDALISKEDMDELILNGYVIYKEASKKVEVE